jgi:coenzyme F420 hydrogenase subunit beta
MQLETMGSESMMNGECRGGQKELEERVIKNGLCTGCGACVNLCPYQASYHDKTVVLHRCDLTDGKCYNFCPKTPVDLGALTQRLFDGDGPTKELGTMIGFYVTRAADAVTRDHAQHGGTVTALMSLALREGIIDSAVLTGGGEGFLPQAVTVCDPDAAVSLSKSRFVVSPMVAEFNRVVKTDARRIGVVATPCQALALAKMRAQDESGNVGGIDKLRLVVGLFCGWALSWRGFASLLEQKTEKARITGMDIPPSRYHNLEVYTDRETVKVSLDEVNPFIRECCHSCSDMTAEFSDLSVGSARLPEGWETARSWNQVIVRSNRGRDLLELARRRGVLEFREVPAGNLEKLMSASLSKKRSSAEHSSAMGTADVQMGHG